MVQLVFSFLKALFSSRRDKLGCLVEAFHTCHFTGTFHNLSGGFLTHIRGGTRIHRHGNKPGRIPGFPPRAISPGGGGGAVAEVWRQMLTSLDFAEGVWSLLSHRQTKGGRGQLGAEGLDKAPLHTFFQPMAGSHSSQKQMAEP